MKNIKERQNNPKKDGERITCSMYQRGVNVICCGLRALSVIVVLSGLYYRINGKEYFTGYERRESEKRVRKKKV